MSKFFDYLIAEAMFNKQITAFSEKSKCRNKEYDRLYNKIIDLAVIKMFENIIDNDLLCVVFKSLSRTERLIILFNVLMDYELEDTIAIIGTNRDSVYSLKCRALKKFKAAIEDVDK